MPTPSSGNPILDRLNQLPPDDRAMLLNILKQQLQGMQNAPKLPQMQGEGTKDQMPTVPRSRSQRNRDLLVDVDSLIELFSTAPA